MHREHPDWPAFMAAIVADPDDDTVRLVAADYLEEHGDPDRAAFIRIQVELAHSKPRERARAWRWTTCGSANELTWGRCRCIDNCGPRRCARSW